MNDKKVDIQLNAEIQDLIWLNGNVFIISETIIWDYSITNNRLQKIYEIKGYYGSKIYDVMYLKDILFIIQGIVNDKSSNEPTHSELIALEINNNDVKKIYNIYPAKRLEIYYLFDKLLTSVSSISANGIDVDLTIIDIDEFSQLFEIKTQHHIKNAKPIDVKQCVLLEYSIPIPSSDQDYYYLWKYNEETIKNFSELLNTKIQCLTLNSTNSKCVFSGNNVVAIYDFEQSKIDQILDKPKDLFSPYCIWWLSSNIIVAMRKTRMVIWNEFNGEIKHDFELPVEKFDGIAFSPDGLLMAITVDGSLYILDVLLGRIKFQTTFLMFENESWLETLKWNISSDRIAGIGTSGDMKIWNLQSKDPLDWYLEVNYYPQHIEF